MTVERQRLLEQTAASAGEAWARRSLLGLRAEGRAVVGGWPGTLSEARAWVSAALVREGVPGATLAELDAAARSTNARARVAWLACAERETEEPALLVLDVLNAGTNPSVNKRQKERQRQEHQREKAEKRKQRRDEKPARPAGSAGEDPDIAGIVPGPQPLPPDA